MLSGQNHQVTIISGTEMTPMYTYILGHRGVGVEKGQAPESCRGPARASSQIGLQVKLGRWWMACGPLTRKSLHLWVREQWAKVIFSNDGFLQEESGHLIRAGNMGCDLEDS